MLLKLITIIDISKYHHKVKDCSVEKAGLTAETTSTRLRLAMTSASNA